MMNRNSGILLHITSLPSPYGVGNLGKAAFDFVDFLKKAGQSYWQILPICPPGYGDSPYQAFSTFAGNPYLIDPDQLVAAGWLTQEELDATYEKFLVLADKKKEIHDYDLIYLVGDIDRMKQQSVALKFLQVTTGTLVPTATVVLKFGDHERMAIATGNGPVDAAVSAIKKLINEKVVLSEFLMQAITRGSNDVGRVHVQVECGSRTVHGFAAHTDTTRASIEAFLDALRALNVTEKREEEA